MTMTKNKSADITRNLFDGHADTVEVSDVAALIGIDLAADLPPDARATPDSEQGESDEATFADINKGDDLPDLCPECGRELDAGTCFHCRGDK
jgi:hypothetical protein